MALAKIATPEDVAAQVVALSSPTISGHVTGQVVTVAGGMEGRVIHGVSAARGVLATQDQGTGELHRLPAAKPTREQPDRARSCRKGARGGEPEVLPRVKD